MIRTLQGEISSLIGKFDLKIDQFNEDIERFYIMNHPFMLHGQLDFGEVERLLFPLGESVVLSLRYGTLATLNGASDEEDSRIFQDLVTEATGDTVQLSLTINKTKLMKLRFHEAKQPLRLFFNPFQMAPFLNPGNYTSIICNPLQHTYIVFPFWQFDKITGAYATLCGTDCENFGEGKDVPDLSGRLESQKLYCNSGTIVQQVLPDYFYFRGKNVIDEFGLLKLYNIALIKTVMHFIANNSDDSLFLVQGFKNIKIKNAVDMSLSIHSEAVAFMYSMYDSIYSSQFVSRVFLEGASEFHTRNFLFRGYEL